MTTIRAGRIIAAAVIPALLFCTRVLADEAPPSVHRQIVELTQQLMDALGEGKPEVWRRVLADDVLITDEFGRRQTKAEAVKSIHPFPAGMSGSIEVRDAHVRHYGGAAVIDCEAYEQETVFGQKLVVRYLFTSTYVRRGGAWKLVAMQDVTLPTQPPVLSVRGLELADYPGTYRYGPERAFIVALEHDKLVWRTKANGEAHVLDPIARDVFMGGDDERNLMIFRRDDAGQITGLIERRKFNDLHLARESSK